MIRFALVCLALFTFACSSPFTAAMPVPDAGVDAFGPDKPWPASRLDGEAPAHLYDDDAALEDVADAGIEAIALDAGDAPDTSPDFSACVPEGNCGGNWWRYSCGEAGAPIGSHCSPLGDFLCCYDTPRGDQ